MIEGAAREDYEKRLNLLHFCRAFFFLAILFVGNAVFYSLSEKFTLMNGVATALAVYQLYAFNPHIRKTEQALAALDDDHQGEP